MHRVFIAESAVETKDSLFLMNRDFGDTLCGCLQKLFQVGGASEKFSI